VRHNGLVNFRRSSPRWALWVFAAALLLKSAMPFLASASAQMQGKALVEVCTVYGVSLVPTGGNSDDGPASDHTLPHTGEHCALTAISALATADPPGPTLAPALSHDRSRPHARPSSEALDACATWVARLKHGPPAFA
jgi:hypothetical protein